MNAQLFRAVYGAHGDDVAKLVLADALQVEGDPRGDFIALQLRDSVISRRRCEKLLARNRDSFLGALLPVIVSPRNRERWRRFDEQWERGFLTVCTVMLNGETVGCPEWTTVRTLHVYEMPDEPAELASPWLKSLQEVFLYGSNELVARATEIARKKTGVRINHVDR